VKKDKKWGGVPEIISASMRYKINICSTIKKNRSVI
jgi:hypothetical protein